MDILSFNIISDFIKKEINEQCGLNLSQTRLLLFFDGNQNQPLTMGKLAHSLNISLSTLSRQLQQDKTKKLINITKSDNDSSKKVNLSTIGVEKMIVLKSTLKQIENQLFNSLTPNDSMLFIKQLAILARKAMI